MITFRQPFKGDYPITQRYGEIIPGVTYAGKPHTGIDYACPERTEILASADGVVKYAEFDKTGYGNTVIIRHNDGRATLYAHLSNILFHVNQSVKQGNVIGLSGNTGNSTGPHLHFEARKEWYDYRSHFDPMQLPLMSFADYDSPIPSKSNSLIDASDLKEGEVQIVAPSGANCHNTDFSDKKAYSFGTNLVFTGEITEHNGLKFCKCNIPVWVAANDGETQILVNK